jgi:LuxR family maltose regulon positive regulatory protein
MRNVVLTTKLNIPQPPGSIVDRDRLIAKLNKGLSSSWILVSAPAGFGKTTLVSEWIHQLECPAGWISLDKTDNNSTTFLIYFLTAIQQMGVDTAGLEAGLIQQLERVGIKSILTFLLNKISEWPDDIVVILDDYHVIEDQAIHDIVLFLIEHLPLHAHLVILTRSDPPFPLSRMRVQQRLVEIRGSDLRFTFEEIICYLEEIAELDLTAEEIQLLENRTEGWVVGLQFAVHSLQKKSREEVRDFIKSFSGSNRYILDFLLEEVFLQQTEEVQVFLLRTSILESLNSSLCETVSGVSGGQAALEYLDMANLFITALDEEREWFRYHALFRDLLNKRLSQYFPDLVPTLHLRASQWFEDKFRVSEAISHARHAGDENRIIKLIEENSLQTALRGEYSILKAWFSYLNDDVIQERPLLSISYGWFLFLSGKYIDVELYIKAAETHLKVEKGITKDRHKDFERKLLALRALYLLEMGRLDEVSKLESAVFENLTEGDDFLKSVLLYSLGGAYRKKGEYDTALEYYAEGMKLSLGARNYFYGFGIAYAMAYMLRRLGRRSEAFKVLNSALEVAEKDKVAEIPAVVFLHRTLSDLCFDELRLDACQDHLQKATDISTKWDFYLRPYCLRAQAYLLQHKGQMDLARKIFLETEEEILNQMSQYILDINGLSEEGLELKKGTASYEWTINYLFDRIYFWISQKDFIEGGKAVEIIANHLEEMGPNEQVVFKLFMTQYRIDRYYKDPSFDYDASEIWELLEKIHTDAIPQGFIVPVIRGHLLKAKHLYLIDNRERMIEEIQKALPDIIRTGYLRLLTDQGELMAKILHLALAQGVEPEFIGEILPKFSTIIDLGDTSKAKDNGKVIQPLTRREIEVLQLVAQGLTNQKIASKLHISIHTVKRHVANISTKLIVNNRTQAVTRARRLGYLRD